MGFGGVEVWGTRDRGAAVGFSECVLFLSLSLEEASVLGTLQLSGGCIAFAEHVREILVHFASDISCSWPN